MALQETTLAMNMGEGVDTKTDPYQLNLGKLAALQNSVFTTGKKLRKRNGFKRLASQLTNPRMLATYQNELLVADANYLYSYDQAADTLINKGFLKSLYTAKQTVTRSGVSQNNQDLCYANGRTLFVYQDSATQVSYSIRDEGTGQLLVDNQILNGNSINARAFVMGSTWVVLMWSTATQGVLYYTINTTSLAVTGPVTIDTGAFNTPIDGVVVTSGPNTHLVIFYNKNATGHLTCVTLSSTFVLGTPFDVISLPVLSMGVWSPSGSDAVYYRCPWSNHLSSKLRRFSRRRTKYGRRRYYLSSGSYRFVLNSGL
jgi:hypothetical protein